MGQINPDHKKKRVGVSRERCEVLLQEVVKRAEEVNSGTVFAYCVDRITVFGSYLTDKDFLGDLDVAVSLKPRFSVRKKHDEAKRKRLDSRSTEPRNLTDWAAWPQTEVLKFLKGRSTALSIHAEADIEYLAQEFPGTKWKVIFGTERDFASQVPDEDTENDGN